MGTLLLDFIIVALMSSAVTLFVKRDYWFKNQRVLWAILRVEHTCMFSVGFLKIMNYCETQYASNSLAALFFAITELHFHAGADWTEHYFYNDMEDTARMTLTWENVLFNIGVYAGMAGACVVTWSM